MKERTKKQLKRKKRRRRTEGRSVGEDRASQGIRPWEPVKMQMFQAPDIFPESMTKEERLMAIRDIGNKASKEFEEKFFAIQKWFKEYDPLYILTFCSVYFLSHPEGIDPETEGYLDFYPHYLEIMQAFALMQERSFSPKPLLDEVETLRQEMKEIGIAMQLRGLAIPESVLTDDELLRHHLQWSMRHQTAAVRNWGYYYQMKRIARSLGGLVKERFAEIYDLDPGRLIDTIFRIVDVANNKLNTHLRKIRSFTKTRGGHKDIFEAYHRVFPETARVSEQDMENIWNHVGENVENLRWFLVRHADTRLYKIYTFSIDELAEIYEDETKKPQLKRIFDSWAYAFGDLKDQNKEHIILDNPIHRKPFIRIDDKNYYSSALGILPHLSLALLEGLISTDEELRKVYSDRIKAEYLEDEVERLFTVNFPSAQIYRGSMWSDPSTGREYENDLLVVIDSFAIVVECKSGQVTPPARRGASDRLRRTIKTLIEEPAEQAHRFVELLSRDRKQHSFRAKGGKMNVVDSSKITYFVPVGLILEELGSIGSNLRSIIDAGFTSKKMSELAPSINFTSLECIFELLPLEGEKVHYLARRREFESHVIYHGDEMDLLGFYLDNGFNIGEVEFKGNVSMNLALKSKELDPYFIAKSQGKRIPKPKRSMTKWWRDILEYIAVRKPEHWVETMFILLSTTKEDQEEFEKKFNSLRAKVRHGKVKQKHNCIAFMSGSKERRYFIAGYPYTTESKDERNSVIASIMESKDATESRGFVCLGINVNKKDYPYSVLVVRLSTDLFTRV